MGPAVRVSEASVVPMALVVSGWKGRAPTQCVEGTWPLRAHAALDRGQAGFQREPQAELNTPSTGPTDLTPERTPVPLPPRGAPT